VSTESITIMCPECGAMREIHDVQAVLLAAHMANECDIATLIVHEDPA
jgi:hypothetical protein